MVPHTGVQCRMHESYNHLVILLYTDTQVSVAEWLARLTAV